MKASERGSVAVLALVIVVIAGLVMVGVARAGAAAGDSARADTAADAAALAAVASLARSEGTPAAVDRARTAAAENGARLLRCDCAGDHAEVVVAARDARGRARAEVDRRCALLDRC
ncbi:MAG: helicase [Acidimicrobiia bacterium]